jgi:hypothetical protein
VFWTGFIRPTRFVRKIGGQKRKNVTTARQKISSLKHKSEEKNDMKLQIVTSNE